MYSVKRHQSEAGAIGEHSPNLEPVQELIIKLHNTFKHSHEDASIDDTILCISDLVVGNTLDEEKRITAHYGIVNGCSHKISRSVKNAMLKDETLANILVIAISDYLDEKGEI